MRALVVSVFLTVFPLASVCAAVQRQKAEKSAWVELLRKGQKEEARQLCTGWLSSDDVSKKVEAYKCLANVELSGASVAFLQGNDIGGAHSVRHMHRKRLTRLLPICKRG
jgi:hypothetical protein